MLIRSLQLTTGMPCDPPTHQRQVLPLPRQNPLPIWCSPPQQVLPLVLAHLQNQPPRQPSPPPLRFPLCPQLPVLTTDPFVEFSVPGSFDIQLSASRTLDTLFPQQSLEGVFSSLPLLTQDEILVYKESIAAVVLMSLSSAVQTVKSASITNVAQAESGGTGFTVDFVIVIEETCGSASCFANVNTAAVVTDFNTNFQGRVNDGTFQAQFAVQQVAVIRLQTLPLTHFNK